jgi:hypothetical protein
MAGEKKGDAAFTLADLLSRPELGASLRGTCGVGALRVELSSCRLRSTTASGHRGSCSGRSLLDCLEGLPRTVSTARGVNERVAVVARLRPGSRDRAAEILAKGAPYGLALAGFRRHSIFLAEESVVFVFEGPGIEGLVRDLVNDPARSAAFSVWAPLLEGTPVLAREEFSWEAGQ